MVPPTSPEYGPLIKPNIAGGVFSMVTFTSISANPSALSVTLNVAVDVPTVLRLNVTISPSLVSPSNSH